MNDPLRPDDAKEKIVEDEIRDQAVLDTGPIEQRYEETDREVPTIIPAAIELPDSHESPTLAAPDAVIDDFVLDADAVPGYHFLGELGRGGMIYSQLYEISSLK
jgi:hypothetical protein